jgi:GH25 family lysozyme M1 (1,4-beta-N-acetylmuramidase)
MIRGIDVSSHQPRDLAAILAEYEVQHVVVKAYLPVEIIGQDYTRAQVASAQQNDCSVGFYVWAYRSVDPRATVRWGAELARSCGVEPAVLWIDCETYQGRSFDPGPDGPWLRAAIDEAQLVGMPLGIYTGWWWIDGYYPGGVAAFAEFSHLPLWVADYDGDPDLANVWSGWARDGWRVLGKQYRGSPIDLDTFDEAAVSAGPGPVPIGEPGEVEGLRVALADACDRVGDKLRARSMTRATRVAIADELVGIREQFLGPRP